MTSQTTQSCAKKTLIAFPSFPSSTSSILPEASTAKFRGHPSHLSVLRLAHMQDSFSLSVYVCVFCFVLFYKSGLILSSNLLFFPHKKSVLDTWSFEEPHVILNSLLIIQSDIMFATIITQTSLLLMESQAICGFVVLA